MINGLRLFNILALVLGGTQLASGQFSRAGCMTFQYDFKPFFARQTEGCDTLNEPTEAKNKTPIRCYFIGKSDSGNSHKSWDMVYIQDSDTIISYGNRLYHVRDGKKLKEYHNKEIYQVVLNKILNNPPSEYINRSTTLGNNFIHVIAWDSLFGKYHAFTNQVDSFKIHHAFDAKFYDQKEIIKFKEGCDIPFYLFQSVTMEGGFIQEREWILTRIEELEPIMVENLRSDFLKRHPLPNEMDFISDSTKDSDILFKLDTVLRNKYALDLNQNRKALFIQDSLTLLEFWYISCLPCQVNIPVWNRLYDTFASDGIRFIALNSQDKHAENIKWFLERKPIKGEICYDQGALAKSLGINAFPTTLLIDGQGKVLKVWTGAHVDGFEAFAIDVRQVLER